MRMATAANPELTRLGAGASPLAEEHSGGVKDRDPVVAVAVSDVDVAVGRIHSHIGRLIQERGARVRTRRAACTGRRVADSLRADLQQEIALARVLLDDAIAVAGDPDIVLIIDKATVDAVRQDRR